MTDEQIAAAEKLSTANNISSENLNSEKNKNQSFLSEEENTDEIRYKEGQILRFVRVRFPGNSRSFPFLIGKRRIEYGQKVVALSDRGMAVGYVNSFPYDIPFEKSLLPIKYISKIATEDDIEKDKEAYRQQKKAENICNDLIEQFQLDMQLTHVEFTSFGKKAVFYFIAPARVDFRELVKELVSRLKTRIELRQISVRDRSAAIGGIGPCGRELCCSSFLTKYGNVGIKMAKNQDLTLNFSKLNGVCGQLKCCLQYEDDVYKEKRNRLPREGDIIETFDGHIGRVQKLFLLNEQFTLLTKQGVRKKFVINQFKKTLNPKDVRFPTEFESISDETHHIIGLEDAEKARKIAAEKNLNLIKKSSKNYTQKVFKDLFGEETLDYSLPEVEENHQFKTNVKSPEEEDEILYTPPEDDILPDDENEDIIDHSPVKIRYQSQTQAQDSFEKKSSSYGRRRNHRKRYDRSRHSSRRADSAQMRSDFAERKRK